MPIPVLAIHTDIGGVSVKPAKARWRGTDSNGWQVPREWHLPRQDKGELMMLVGLSAMEWERLQDRSADGSMRANPEPVDMVVLAQSLRTIADFHTQ
jgi:hypothetical protein